MKIVTVVGARPQIIKSAALSRVFSDYGSIKEILVHTGQHYDYNMSDIFYQELDLCVPDYNLGIGSGYKLPLMIEGIRKVLKMENPNCVILYGDTNSTLAGTLAASSLNIPIVHVEAGLRSFNKLMPEETNRIICDHCSSILFSPTITGIENLIKEGFKLNTDAPYSINNPAVFHCGDIMYDNSLYFKRKSDRCSSIIKNMNLKKNGFVLTTIHRAENSDNENNLKNILLSIVEITKRYDIEFVLPLHPRTRKNISNYGLEMLLNNCKSVKVIEPVSFLDMIALESNCNLIMTDSGGVQKEAYFFEKPVVVIRKETEWSEIINMDAGVLAYGDVSNIVSKFEFMFFKEKVEFPSIFGNGNAASFIINKLIDII